MASSHFADACPFCYSPSTARTVETDNLQHRECPRCGKRWAIAKVLVAEPQTIPRDWIAS